MALDLMTGKTIWERDLGSKAVSIAAHGDRIVAGTVSRMFFGLDERRGEIKWRWRIGGDVVGRPAFSDDMVFVITLSNEMRGFKLNDGGQKWRQPLDFRALGRADADRRRPDGPELFADAARLQHEETANARASTRCRSASVRHRPRRRW